VLKGHTALVNSVAISTEGAKIVSGSRDGTVRVWNAETGQVSPQAVLCSLQTASRIVLLVGVESH
jgi:WD40 repeat protein